MRIRILVVALALAPALAVGWPGAPAFAHPFGPPPTASVSAQDHKVFVDWRASADDAIAIGIELGLLAPDTLDAYREGPTQVAPSARDERRLAQSDQLRAYLLGHIVVSQDGDPCDGSVTHTTDFVYAGARVVYRCPETIAGVELRISMLHDIHEAYRTFATMPSAQPSETVFTVSSPSHSVDFTAGAGQSDSTRGLWPLTIVGGAGLAGSIVALRLRRGPR